MKPIAITIYAEYIDDYKYRAHALKITHNYSTEKSAIFGVTIQPRTTTDAIFINQNMYGPFDPRALMYSDYFEITYENYTRVELQ